MLKRVAAQPYCRMTCHFVFCSKRCDSHIVPFPLRVLHCFCGVAMEMGGIEVFLSKEGLLWQPPSHVNLQNRELFTCQIDRRTPVCPHWGNSFRAHEHDWICCPLTQNNHSNIFDSDRSFFRNNLTKKMDGQYRTTHLALDHRPFVRRTKGPKEQILNESWHNCWIFVWKTMRAHHYWTETNTWPMHHSASMLHIHMGCTQQPWRPSRYYRTGSRVNKLNELLKVSCLQTSWNLSLGMLNMESFFAEIDHETVFFSLSRPHFTPSMIDNIKGLYSNPSV